MFYVKWGTIAFSVWSGAHILWICTPLSANLKSFVTLWRVPCCKCPHATKKFKRLNSWPVLFQATSAHRANLPGERVQERRQQLAEENRRLELERPLLRHMRGLWEMLGLRYLKWFFLFVLLVLFSLECLGTFLWIYPVCCSLWQARGISL